MYNIKMTASSSLILPIPSFSSSTRLTHSSYLPQSPILLLHNYNNWVRGRVRGRVRAIQDKTKPIETPPSSPEDVTKKYGLEVGLWKIFSTKEGEENKSKGEQAKELLAKYGGAYLATSITLSLISFTLCYVLINAGVDVPALLQKVGIATNETGEKVGTFALAYAAHKAASPIRFPPTVALTPIVAGWIGKKADKEN